MYKYLYTVNNIYKMAKLTTIEYMSIEKEVEVDDIPYYYKHDLSDKHGKWIIYGRTDGNLTIIIHEKDAGYEIKREEGFVDNCYFAQEYKSTASEYKEVKKRLKEFYNRFISYN